jgi:predicted kinase
VAERWPGGPCRLPDPCLVVLIGPAGAGKTTWALGEFGSWRVVSTDALRAVVGLDERDQRASKDAFDLVDRIVDARLRRGFTTVVDSTGLDGKRRRGWVAAARKRGVPVYAVVFDLDERTVRSRNRQRARPVPSAIVTAQLRSMPAVRELVAAEFDGELPPGDVELVPARFLAAPEAAARQREGAMGLEFGMQVGAFPDGVATLGATARAAEEVGFASVSVMDHLVQIPQIAALWADIPEGWTSVGYLAAATSRVRIGTLVTNVLLRNPALLAKMVATVDVLSGGRVFCALGAGWFDKELQTYGYGRLPPAAERLDRLEEVLQVLPRYWGPGEPTCYPRPLQERVPIIVGGNGERRTLRLVARYADGCNLQGEPDVVAAKVAVLRRHCDEVGRDPAGSPTCRRPGSSGRARSATPTSSGPWRSRSAATGPWPRPASTSASWASTARPRRSRR